MRDSSVTILNPFKLVKILSKIYVHLLIILAPVSEYIDTSNEDEKKCRHANCLCDMEMVRCMKHYKDEINTDNILYQQCDVKGKIFVP